MSLKSLFMAVAFVIMLSTRVLSATDNNSTVKVIPQITATPIVTKTYKEANSSENNISKWNTKDWEGSFAKSGLTSTSMIGNTNALFGGSEEGKIANSGDMEQLKTTSLKQNKKLSGNKSIGAFDSILMNKVMNDTVNSAFGKAATHSKNIKCYITRNIGTTYMCMAPGNSLRISSGMSGRESLSRLKEQCEGQCFTQNSCVDMQANEQNITTNIGTKSFILSKNTPSYSVMIPTQNTLTIRTLELIESIKNANVNYTISYMDLKGKKQVLVSNMISVADSNGSWEYYIGDIASSITVTVSLIAPFSDTIQTPMTLSGIAVNYHSNSQYVCPSVQDTANFLPGNFANVCSNGIYTTLTRTANGKSISYKICASTNYPGQNMDGSFYQKNSCESICRKQYSCSLLAGSAPNFESLKGFQEGCIENSSLECNNFNNDCATARLSLDAKVINELVFGANSRPVTTVVNGVSTGLERPRVSISNLSPSLGSIGGTYAPNDIEFEEQKKEEWKDAAYTDMMNKAAWNVSGITIGENTVADHAYGINLKSGSFYGFAGTSVRALMWRLKPAAYDVDTSVSFKLYSVFRVIVQNNRYDQTGNGEKKPYYDEIWYVKQGAGDSFKPFYYIYDAYDIQKKAGDYGLTTISYVPKTTAIPKFSTFSGNEWVGISGSDMAENFKSDNFSATNAFWEYELIGDLDNDFELFPGLIHSVSTASDNTDIINYTGTRSYGSSGVIVKLFANVGYTTSSLSYESIVNMVKSSTMTTIYEKGNENAYPRAFRGDGTKDNEVSMYLYGKQNKGSAYFEIKTKQEDIGKKGFIYIFAE